MQQERIKTTDELLEIFNGLVRDQYSYGGQKYALENKKSRESTDDLFDDFGQGWLFGTMAKYVKRYRNLKRERDPLKIACYAYLVWLKKGFHVMPSGLKVDVLDTHVEQKEAYFEPFLSNINHILANHVLYFPNQSEVSELLDRCYQDLVHWTKNKWGQIGAVSIYLLYYKMFLVWKENHGQTERHDTDTSNTN